jgi:hypothetical protein
MKRVREKERERGRSDDMSRRILLKMEGLREIGGKGRGETTVDHQFD